MEMEDMNVLISQYPAIAAKAAEIGKIKQGMLNKKTVCTIARAVEVLHT